MKRLFVVVCVALLCSACLRATTTITVRQDGSGLIDQEVGANPQAMAMLKGFAGATAEQKGGTPAATPSIFGETEAKKMADQMGVKFVSGEPIKTGDLEGYRAHYSFDDVTKLKVKMNQDATGGLAETSKTAAEPPFGFQFEKHSSSSILTINMPEQKPGSAGPLNQLGMGRGASQNPAQNEQAIAMMKMMLKGLYVDVTLAVDGKVIKTNAPYVTGSRVTLVQMDFDKLLADEGALQKLQQANDPRMLKDIPGLKVVAEPKVTIEFGR